MTKQLTQDVFKGAPPWVKSASITAYGRLMFHGVHKSKLLIADVGMHYSISSASVCESTKRYDYTNWQHSAIDRE